jgi:hypothetical protein
MPRTERDRFKNKSRCLISICGDYECVLCSCTTRISSAQKSKLTICQIHSMPVNGNIPQHLSYIHQENTSVQQYRGKCRVECQVSHVLHTQCILFAVNDSQSLSEAIPSPSVMATPITSPRRQSPRSSRSAAEVKRHRSISSSSNVIDDVPLAVIEGGCNAFECTLV